MTPGLVPTIFYFIIIGISQRTYYQLVKPSCLPTIPQDVDLG
jgi:predicted DNA-binding transcriptional regulator AlpA